MRALIVCEYYPRAGDPARGIWAHRQALAARAAGAEVRVLVLHRPIPPIAALRRRDLHAIAAPLRQARRADLDGVKVDYLRYLSPPRPLSYGSWGAFAAPVLARALRQIRAEWPFDLIHAHYAVPAGDAVRRVAPGVPLIVSVHGHDVFGTASVPATVRRTLRRADLVLANSAGTAERAQAAGARSVEVVHLGTDVPPVPRIPPSAPVIACVGNLVPRKHQDDVLRAAAMLLPSHPTLEVEVVGDGPERERLVLMARELGIERLVRFRGALPPADALATAQRATVFVLPSTDEAFGVAYIEAMAAGVPGVATAGEPGPEEIAALGGGILLTPPRDPNVLAEAIGGLLGDPERLGRVGAQARANVEANFTWEQCGRATFAAYARVF